MWAVPLSEKITCGLLGIKDEKARIKVTPPLVVAPIAQEDVIRTTKTTRTNRTNTGTKQNENENSKWAF